MAWPCATTALEHALLEQRSNNPETHNCLLLQECLIWFPAMHGSPSPRPAQLPSERAQDITHVRCLLFYLRCKLQPPGHLLHLAASLWSRMGRVAFLADSYKSDWQSPQLQR